MLTDPVDLVTLTNHLLVQSGDLLLQEDRLIGQLGYGDVLTLELISKQCDFRFTLTQLILDIRPLLLPLLYLILQLLLLRLHLSYFRIQLSYHTVSLGDGCLIVVNG